MEEKLLYIINHYGISNQLRKFNEEVFELNEALIEHEILEDCGLFKDSDESETRQHIIEEIADVMVMLEQFKLYYYISSEEITDIFWKKVDRQLERIKNENN